jgi:hypothetical protein
MYRVRRRSHSAKSLKAVGIYLIEDAIFSRS